MIVKKLFLISMIVLCVTFSVSAYDYVFDGSAGGLPILGFMDGYYMVTIDPIVNTGDGNLDLYIGMPFNLLGEDVSYKGENSPLGRTIATWSLVVNLKANRPWRLGINAKNLTYDDTSIGYYLLFVTDHEGGGDDYWIVHSTTTNDFTYFPDENGKIESVASLNDQVRFMLDAPAEAAKNSFQESYDYTATVTICLEGE